MVLDQMLAFLGVPAQADRLGLSELPETHRKAGCQERTCELGFPSLPLDRLDRLLRPDRLQSPARLETLVPRNTSL